MLTPKTPQENKALAQARTLALLREKLAKLEKELNEWRIEAIASRKELINVQAVLDRATEDHVDQYTDFEAKLSKVTAQRDSTQQQYQSAIRREQNLILANAQLKNEATMRLERWGKHTLECAKRHRLGPCDCGFDGAKVFV